MSVSKISEQFIHPLIVGGLTYVGAQMLGEGNKSAYLGGMRMSLPMFMGLTSGVSSVLGESLKQWVLPVIPGNMNYASLESTILSPALVGGVNAVSFYLLTKTRFMEAFMLGAGSEILGSYIYDGVISPYIQ